MSLDNTPRNYPDQIEGYPQQSPPHLAGSLTDEETTAFDAKGDVYHRPDPSLPFGWVEEWVPPEPIELDPSPLERAAPAPGPRQTATVDYGGVVLDAGTTTLVASETMTLGDREGSPPRTLRIGLYSDDTDTLGRLQLKASASAIGGAVLPVGADTGGAFPILWLDVRRVHLASSAAGSSTFSYIVVVGDDDV